MTTAELVRHPWNTSFEWPTHDGPFRRVTADQAQAYDEQGFFLLEDVFDADTLTELRDIIEPHEREVNDFLRQIEGGRISVARADALTVTLHLSTKSEVAKRFCAHPVFADLCHDLIGPDARLYWDQAVYKMPHTGDPVPWHQDNGYAYVEPQAYLTCWVPLVDATLENGCVWVMPGVHRNGTIVHRETDLGQECIPEGTDGAVPVEASAGSVVVFTSLTPHRTGPNRTDGVRSSYILQYAPDGAEALQGDPARAPTSRVPQDDPDRQFPVVRDGRPVTP
jgi:ectoine hydroxylase-related dioxygenase (phytanoyl-CoA dioxygenase family)